ncbi:MAG: hypothetical protein V5789_04755 [Colwellia sp.]
MKKLTLMTLLACSVLMTTSASARDDIGQYSVTEFECGADAIMAGVALKGTLVKFEQ